MTIIDANRTAIDSLVAPTPFPGSFAVSYLRVSTKEQAEKGGQAEGFSIPAQREANQRKADQLGATIIEEFVDAGESARKADRPELMRMIQYVAKHKTSIKSTSGMKLSSPRTVTVGRKCVCSTLI